MKIIIYIYLEHPRQDKQDADRNGTVLLHGKLGLSESKQLRPEGQRSGRSPPTRQSGLERQRVPSRARYETKVDPPLETHTQSRVAPRMVCKNTANQAAPSGPDCPITPHNSYHMLTPPPKTWSGLSRYRVQHTQRRAQVP